jgi:hypothetical protein
MLLHQTWQRQLVTRTWWVQQRRMLVMLELQHLGKWWVQQHRM